eukprot:s1565_g7.t3
MFGGFSVAISCSPQGGWHDHWYLGSQSISWQPYIVMAQKLQGRTAKDWAKELAALTKRAQWRESLHLLASMELQALQPDIIMQNSLLSASVRHHWQLALVDLRSKGYQLDQVTMGIVVKACEKHWQAAQASLASCNAYAPSVVSYGAALSTAERGNAWEQVGTLHRDLQVKGLQPNTVVYNTWITSRREHDWRIAVSLYNSLQEMLLQPTVVTLATMITGMANAWQLAMEFLREIREQQLQGNMVAYNAAISSCEKASQWTWALHLQQWAAAESLHPNVITYSAAVSACEKAAEWEPALSLLLCADKQQVEKNLVTYNAFLGACQNAWQWKRSLAALRALHDADVISLTSAVTSLGETSQWCRSAGPAEIPEGTPRSGSRPATAKHSIRRHDKDLTQPLKELHFLILASIAQQKVNRFMMAGHAAHFLSTFVTRGSRPGARQSWNTVVLQQPSKPAVQHLAKRRQQGTPWILLGLSTSRIAAGPRPSRRVWRCRPVAAVSADDGDSPVEEIGEGPQSCGLLVDAFTDVIDVRFLVDIRTLPLEPEAMDLEPWKWIFGLEKHGLGSVTSFVTEDILYEDDELLVINKPAGLVNGVLHHLGFASSELSTLPNAAELRPGIVHRLDVGTTGVIAVAKTASSYSVLSQAFAQREVQKTYLAVVLGGRKSFFGHPKGSGHRVEKAIGRSVVDRRLMTTLDVGGRPALSFVRAIAREKDLLLVEVKPRTGRTHQIRVHMAEEHSPILGDTAYGWHHMNRRYASWAQRPMLHAFELSLQHPLTAEHLTFRAPVPEDMRQLIRRSLVEWRARD